MLRTGKNITILLYQYSVVISGIERRLKDAGYNVEVLETFEQIPKYTDRTDVFLTYLPNDIMESEVKQERLTYICRQISERNGRLILMGENGVHRRLKVMVPLILNNTWIDFPVNIEELLSQIKNVISSKDAKSILIVDDDPSYAGMVREWIKDEYRVDIVTAGMQAIKFLLKKPVDLILLDYEMPVVDGPQVLQMLRQEDATKDIPVVFLTGVGTKEGVERVMELKPSGYILKTTTREKLLVSLERVLG